MFDDDDVGHVHLNHQFGSSSEHQQQSVATDAALCTLLLRARHCRSLPGQPTVLSPVDMLGVATDWQHGKA